MINTGTCRNLDLIGKQRSLEVVEFIRVLEILFYYLQLYPQLLAMLCDIMKNKSHNTQEAEKRWGLRLRFTVDCAEAGTVYKAYKNTA